MLITKQHIWSRIYEITPKIRNLRPISANVTIANRMWNGKLSFFSGYSEWNLKERNKELSINFVSVFVVF